MSSRVLTRLQDKNLLHRIHGLRRFFLPAKIKNKEAYQIANLHKITPQYPVQIGFSIIQISYNSIDIDNNELSDPYRNQVHSLERETAQE